MNKFVAANVSQLSSTLKMISTKTESKILLTHCEGGKSK